MTTNLSAYKALYLETARKLVEEYSHIKSSQVITDSFILDLLRIFHSLKGQSLAMNYKNIAQLSLQIEMLCKTMSENRSPLTSSLKDQLPLPKIFLDDITSIETTDTELSLMQEIELVQKLVEQIKSRSMQILIVEDDAFFQKICIDKLREKEVLVDFVSNGEEAIVRLATKKYNCVLLDIIMPKKNGFDVLQYAKENNILPKTPFIVFSTLGQEDNVQKALSMGAADFINKGNFDFDLLMSKIETVVTAAHKMI